MSLKKMPLGIIRLLNKRILLNTSFTKTPNHSSSIKWEILMTHVFSHNYWIWQEVNFHLGNFSTWIFKQTLMGLELQRKAFLGQWFFSSGNRSFTVLIRQLQQYNSCIQRQGFNKVLSLINKLVGVQPLMYGILNMLHWIGIAAMSSSVWLVWTRHNTEP